MVLSWRRLLGSARWGYGRYCNLNKEYPATTLVMTFVVKTWRFFTWLYFFKKIPHILEEIKTLSRKIQASRKLALTALHQTGEWWWKNGWMYCWVCWIFQNYTAKLPLLSDVIYSFDKQKCFREWFVWLFEHSAQWSVKYEDSTVRNVEL